MTTVKDICWFAGLLEGDGRIVYDGSTPTIVLSMTSEDVVRRAANLVSRPVIGPYWKHGPLQKKAVWRMSLHGTPAIEWMMTLYSQMGLERRIDIKVAVEMWKKGRGKGRRREE